MGEWLMAQCSIRVTLLCWCIDAIYNGGNILQWYTDSKHGCIQQHYGTALSRFFFLFLCLSDENIWVMPLWHWWSPQKEKVLISLRVTLGPLPLSAGAQEVLDACPHRGQPHGVDRLWPPPASQLDGPGSICSLVSVGLPMPLKDKRLPDPSCCIASMVCVYSLLPLPVNDERCLFSRGFALLHSQWAKCIAATKVYWAIRLQ